MCHLDCTGHSPGRWYKLPPDRLEGIGHMHASVTVETREVCTFRWLASSASHGAGSCIEPQQPNYPKTGSYVGSGAMERCVELAGAKCDFTR